VFNDVASVLNYSQYQLASFYKEEIEATCISESLSFKYFSLGESKVKHISMYIAM